MTKNLPAEAIEKWLNDIPLKRAGTTEDVANAALFLACDLSSYISGQVIQVCGGMNT
jgi:3-oxoacyl-[acyl-carrier protein] reductase